MNNKSQVWLLVIIAVIVIAVVIGVIVFYSQRQSSTGSVIVPLSQDVVKFESSSLGDIMAGMNSMTLYIFEADTSGDSTCYGQCTTFWPPLLVASGTTLTGQGVSATLGTTQRTDGTFQLTSNGRPLYYYSGDHSAGDANGQGLNAFGALWYAVSPSGDVVTTPVSSPSSSNSSSGSSSSSSRSSSSSSSSSSSGSSGGY